MKLKKIILCFLIILSLLLIIEIQTFRKSNSVDYFYMNFKKFQGKWYRQDSLLKKTSKEIQLDFKAMPESQEYFILEVDTNKLLCYTQYTDYIHELYLFSQDNENITVSTCKPELKYQLTDKGLIFDMMPNEYLDYLNYFVFSIIEEDKDQCDFYIYKKDLNYYVYDLKKLNIDFSKDIKIKCLNAVYWNEPIMSLNDKAYDYVFSSPNQ